MSDLENDSSSDPSVLIPKFGLWSFPYLTAAREPSQLLYNAPWTIDSVAPYDAAEGTCVSLVLRRALGICLDGMRLVHGPCWESMNTEQAYWQGIIFKIGTYLIKKKGLLLP